ncbi:MAG: response regulator [Chloroflexi bacterium]|nr:response regulator [Chloroflexota bacterium]
MASKVALVIDDPDVLEMMQAVLRDEGYETVGCSPSRLDCARELAYVQPDAILLDVPLGQPAFTVDDAMTLVEALKANAATCDTPIVMCGTVERALATHRPRLDALECDFIAKPFDISEMLGQVARRLRPKAA